MVQVRRARIAAGHFSLPEMSDFGRMERRGGMKRVVGGWAMSARNSRPEHTAAVTVRRKRVAIYAAFRNSTTGRCRRPWKRDT